MLVKAHFIVLLFLGLNCFANDREAIIKKMIADGEYEAVAKGLTKILDHPDCQPFDYSYLIYAHMVLGDFKNGLIYADKWLNKAIENRDTTNLLKAARYKTECSHYLNDTEGGIEAAQFALRHYKKDDSIGITKTNLHLGLFHFENGDYQLAYDTYRKIDYKNVIASRKKDDYFMNFGIIYAKVGNSDSSIYFMKQSLQLEKEREDFYGIVLSHSNIASAYMDLNNYEMALIHLDSTKRTKLDPNHPVFELVYENYYMTFSQLGQVDSSFFYVKKSKELNQYLFQQKMDQEVLELKNSYKREDNLKTKIVKSSEDLEASKEQLLIGVIAVLLIVIIAGSLLLFLRYKNLKSSRDNLLITQRLLRSQITPHFLFNSLATIQGMILNGENKTASNYLSKFSRLVRLILKNSRDRVVSLADELEAIKNYLDLQNARFSEAFEYSIQIKENIMDESTYIPPMLIQPFVENAIEHGFKNLDRKGKIVIDIFLEKKSLVCKIVDNGIGVNSITDVNTIRKKESLSTAITAERIALLAKEFKAKAGLSIVDREKYNEQGTIVTLTIPYLND